MAGLRGLVDKAKNAFRRRGGTQASKEDAQELKDIQAGGGTTTDKAKEAAEALKQPGAKGPEQQSERSGGSDELVVPGRRRTWSGGRPLIQPLLGHRDRGRSSRREPRRAIPLE
jgi:hypothetical protein